MPSEIEELVILWGAILEAIITPQLLQFPTWREELASKLQELEALKSKMHTLTEHNSEDIVHVVELDDATRKSMMANGDLRTRYTDEAAHLQLATVACASSIQGEGGIPLKRNLLVITPRNTRKMKGVTLAQEINFKSSSLFISNPEILGAVRSSEAVAVERNDLIRNPMLKSEVLAVRREACHRIAAEVGIAEGNEFAVIGLAQRIKQTYPHYACTLQEIIFIAVTPLVEFLYTWILTYNCWRKQLESSGTVPSGKFEDLLSLSTPFGILFYGWRSAKPSPTPQQSSRSSENLGPQARNTLHSKTDKIQAMLRGC